MRTAEIVKGSRVKYIGLAVQVALPGELGTVIATDINPRSASGRLRTDDRRMLEIAWDGGAASYCWPAELELIKPAI